MNLFARFPTSLLHLTIVSCTFAHMACSEESRPPSSQPKGENKPSPIEQKPLPPAEVYRATEFIQGISLSTGETLVIENVEERTQDRQVISGIRFHRFDKDLVPAASTDLISRKNLSNFIFEEAVEGVEEEFLKAVDVESTVDDFGALEFRITAWKVSLDTWPPQIERDEPKVYSAWNRTLDLERNKLTPADSAAKQRLSLKNIGVDYNSLVRPRLLGSGVIHLNFLGESFEILPKSSRAIATRPFLISPMDLAVNACEGNHADSIYVINGDKKALRLAYLSIAHELDGKGRALLLARSDGETTEIEVLLEYSEFDRVSIDACLVHNDEIYLSGGINLKNTKSQGFLARFDAKRNLEYRPFFPGKNSQSLMMKLIDQKLVIGGRTDYWLADTGSWGPGKAFVISTSIGSKFSKEDIHNEVIFQGPRDSRIRDLIEHEGGRFLALGATDCPDNHDPNRNSQNLISAFDFDEIDSWINVKPLSIDQTPSQQNQTKERILKGETKP